MIDAPARLNREARHSLPLILFRTAPPQQFEEVDLSEIIVIAQGIDNGALVVSKQVSTSPPALKTTGERHVASLVRLDLLDPPTVGGSHTRYRAIAGNTVSNPVEVRFVPEETRWPTAAPEPANVKVGRATIPHEPGIRASGSARRVHVGFRVKADGDTVPIDVIDPHTLRVHRGLATGRRDGDHLIGTAMLDLPWAPDDQLILVGPHALARGDLRGP